MFNAQYRWQLFVICLGVTLHALDSLVVSTMLPAMIADIGGIHLVSWAFGLYEIGTIIVSALCGVVTIRHGVRAPMFAAACVFALGCSISAFASTMEIVLVGRLLQGLGGGGLLAISFVASALLFPERILARVMGAISIFWGSTGFLGPLLGGVFVEFYTWRFGFWFFAFSSAILAIIILKIIKDVPEEVKTHESARYPIKRVMLLALGISLITTSTINSGGLSLLLIVTGILCLFKFLRLDAKKGKQRMLPLNPLNLNTPLGSAIGMIVCFAAGSSALSIYGALFMTMMHSTSALIAGYVVACPAIGWATATVLVSGLSENNDRSMIRLGMILAAIGISGFVYAVPNGPIWLVVVFALLEGVGFGISWAFIPRRIRNISKTSEIARNASVIPTAEAIGYALGAAYVGSVANASGLVGALEGDALFVTATTVFLAGVPIALLGLFSMRTFTCKAICER